jgi:plastocyanin
MRKLILIGVGVLLFGTLAVTAFAASRSVRVGDNWFVRASGVPTVTVDRGTTVTWRFVGRDPHNVVVTRGPVKFRSGIQRSGTYRKKVRRRGTYTLICDIHGARDQKMRLVVR